VLLVVWELGELVLFALPWRMRKLSGRSRCDTQRALRGDIVSAQPTSEESVSKQDAKALMGEVASAIRGSFVARVEE